MSNKVTYSEPKDYFSKEQLKMFEEEMKKQKEEKEKKDKENAELRKVFKGNK